VTDQLLATKLHVPRLRRASVARGRLTERLQRGAGARLTLISAPAGFGKTTLLAEWAALRPDAEHSVAWVSLDEGDGAPVSFWTYIVSALDGVAPGVGLRALSLLRESRPRPIEVVVAALLNDLSALQRHIGLILDDYHTVEGPDLEPGMSYLLEHLPAQLRLVIATRADPALPLARLRARGELVEIRAADLRFTAAEATEYLHQSMGLDLAAHEIATLEGRTEGWIAALQLAALSMQGRDDVAGFIAGFAGDDRYIVDYLAEEVLQRQPERVRTFLLRTSILGRLTGSLVDAVTGQDGGRGMLESLERGNLFLVALDDRRQWYRYHHLFADVLRSRLLDERPEDVARLHQRAADWFEEHGQRADAVRHALAAGGVERAADLIELAIPETSRARQEATLRSWLEALPVDLLRTRPVLSNAYAGSFLVRGETEGIEEHLRIAERWLEAAANAQDGMPPPGMVVIDEQAYRELPAGVAIHRAGQASLLGDQAGAMAHARRALELVGEDAYQARGAAAALLGITCWATGDLGAAERHCRDAIGDLQRAGFHSDALGLAIKLADIQAAQGRLGDAFATYERGRQLSIDHGAPPLRGTADMLVGLSAICRERDDLEAARRYLHESRGLGEHSALPQDPYRSRVALALIRQSEGDLDDALGLLEAAERLYDGDYSPDVRPVGATRARLLVARDRLAEAGAWARSRGLSLDHELSYVREFEHATLARVLLAQAVRDRARGAMTGILEFLGRLLKAAEQGDRAGAAIDILVVRSLVHQAAGDTTAAIGSLEQALGLAEPEGYVRIFLDEGPPMVTLLERAARGPRASAYASRLLSGPGPLQPRAAVAQLLIEPLSERELEVLHLLASDLTGPAIAGELVVSLPTVRTHTRNVYTKLGVNNRMAAVRRASELGLLSRARIRPPHG
jgi:LuxR family maltose regulon positive regulatory protein